MRFDKPLKELTEADLQAMCDERIQESVDLDFKRELHLDSNGQKKELLKDVSALANVVGGRIFYGIDEDRTADKNIGVAKAVAPLTDTGLRDRLENVLNSGIKPRPRFHTHVISVAGGHVLAVEVSPSYGADLHMVEYDKDMRFYTRSGLSSVPMGEAEIRERYARIAASRFAVENSLNTVVASELTRFNHMREAVFVLPWYANPRMIEPRPLGPSFGRELEREGVVDSRHWSHTLASAGIAADGYRAITNDQSLAGPHERGCAILRNGAVWLAHSGHVDGDNKLIVVAGMSFKMIECAISLARAIYRRVSYGGPVRVVHCLRPVRLKPTFLDDITYSAAYDPFEHADKIALEDKDHDHVVAEVEIRDNASIRAAVRELMDMLFQADGRHCCSWYYETGELNITQRERLNDRNPNRPSWW